MIPTEIVISILSLIGVGLSAWVVRVKDKSIANKEKELADAKAKVMAAEGELTEIKADAEQQTALARIAERQQTLLEALKISQDHSNAENLTRWGTVSALFNDIRAQEVNIYNAMLQVSTTLSQMRSQQQTLPDMIQTASNLAAKEIAGITGAEIGAAMAREFAIKNLERKLHPFPDAEDPRWREDFIYPTLPEVIIHKETYFDDDIKLKKPCARIAPEGERVLMIEESSIGWVAIDKVADGSRCWGWLPAQFVKIGQAVVPANV